jgi:hypothetical protein
MIGDSQTIHPHSLGLEEEILDVAHTVQQAVLGMNVKVGKHRPYHYIISFAHKRGVRKRLIRRGLRFRMMSKRVYLC